MAVVSGIGTVVRSPCVRSFTNRDSACTFGASIICVDLVIRMFPRYRNFKIEDSNSFLSTGLSLSFGVMVCNDPTVRWFLC